MTTEPPAHPAPHRRGALAALRASFLTGLVVILPGALTLYLIWTVTGWIDGWVSPLIPAPWRPDVILRARFGPGSEVPSRLIAVFIFLAATVLVGWLAKGLIGRTVIRRAERMVDRMPVVRSIYNGAKQIAETVFAQTEKSFQRACLVEYPRRGVWALAFVAVPARGEIAEKVPGGDDLLTVFMPTTPNPTTGFLFYVAASDVILLDMTLEDAAKLIISAGLVYPPPRPPAPAT